MDDLLYNAVMNGQMSDIVTIQKCQPRTKPLGNMSRHRVLNYELINGEWLM